MATELLMTRTEHFSDPTYPTLSTASVLQSGTKVLTSRQISPASREIKFTMEKMQCDLTCTILNRRWKIAGTVKEQATRNRAPLRVELITSHLRISFRADHSCDCGVLHWVIISLPKSHQS